MSKLPSVALIAGILVFGGTAQAAPVKPDITPPTVRISGVPTTGPLTDTFLVQVGASDDSGIATVFVSVAGVIVEGRTVNSFGLALTPASLPAQACAVATDMSGNAARSCVTLGCTTDAICPAGGYCVKPEADCGGLGYCGFKPVVCEAVVEPVCGCNGTTYNNDCEAAAAGINVSHTGTCP